MNGNKKSATTTTIKKRKGFQFYFIETINGKLKINK